MSTCLGPGGVRWGSLVVGKFLYGSEAMATEREAWPLLLPAFLGSWRFLCNSTFLRGAGSFGRPLLGDQGWGSPSQRNRDPGLERGSQSQRGEAFSRLVSGTTQGVGLPFLACSLILGPGC